MSAFAMTSKPDQGVPRGAVRVVGFASRPSLDWPLSSDVWSLRPVVAALGAQNAEPMRIPPPRPNSCESAPSGNRAISGLAECLLYFGCDGPASVVPQSEFDFRRGSVHGGAVLAYGRSDAIGEAALRPIAQQLDVPFLHREPGLPLLLRLPDAPHSTEAAEQIEMYWLPALLAAGLLLAEIYLSVREFRRSRISRREMALVTIRPARLRLRRRLLITRHP